MLNGNKQYTGLNIDGVSTLETDILAAVTLAADVTLSAAQAKVGRIEITTGHASNTVIIPAALAVKGKIYIVKNNHATLAAGIKVEGGTAVTVAATKCAIVQVNSAGTEVERVTADS